MAGRRRWITARETADRRGEQFLTLRGAVSLGGVPLVSLLFLIASGEPARQRFPDFHVLSLRGWVCRLYPLVVQRPSQ